MADSHHDSELTTPRKLTQRLQTALGRQQSFTAPSPFIHSPAPPEKLPFISDRRHSSPLNSSFSEIALSVFNQHRKEQLDSVKVAKLVKANYIAAVIAATRCRKTELLLKEKSERLVKLTQVISEQKREIDRLTGVVGHLHSVSVEQKQVLDSLRLSLKAQQDLFNKTLQDNIVEIERHSDVISQWQHLQHKSLRNQFYNQLLADACFTAILLHLPLSSQFVFNDLGKHTIWKKFYTCGEKLLPLLLLMRFYLLLKRIEDNHVQISGGQLYSFLQLAGSTLMECKLIHGLVNRLLVS